jgi:hypothetical protein
MWPAGGLEAEEQEPPVLSALYHKLYRKSNAPEDEQNNCPKHVELIGIINKQLLLHIAGCLPYYLYQ